MSTVDVLGAVVLGLALAVLPFLHFSGGHAPHSGGAHVDSTHPH